MYKLWHYSLLTRILLFSAGCGMNLVTDTWTLDTSADHHRRYPTKLEFTENRDDSEEGLVKYKLTEIEDDGDIDDMGKA